MSTGDHSFTDPTAMELHKTGRTCPMLSASTRALCSTATAFCSRQWQPILRNGCTCGIRTTCVHVSPALPSTHKARTHTHSPLIHAHQEPYQASTPKSTEQSFPGLTELQCARVHVCAWGTLQRFVLRNQLCPALVTGMPAVVQLEWGLCERQPSAFSHLLSEGHSDGWALQVRTSSWDGDLVSWHLLNTFKKREDRVTPWRHALCAALSCLGSSLIPVLHVSPGRTPIELMPTTQLGTSGVAGADDGQSTTSTRPVTLNAVTGWSCEASQVVAVPFCRMVSMAMSRVVFAVRSGSWVTVDMAPILSSPIHPRCIRCPSLFVSARLCPSLIGAPGVCNHLARRRAPGGRCAAHGRRPLRTWSCISFPFGAP